jgi:hypothetical protein
LICFVTSPALSGCCGSLPEGSEPCLDLDVQGKQETVVSLPTIRFQPPCQILLSPPLAKGDSRGFRNWGRPPNPRQGRSRCTPSRGPSRDPALTKHRVRLTRALGTAIPHSQSARRYVAMCFALTIAWSTFITPSSVMMRVIRFGGIISKPSSSHRWRPASRKALNLVVSQTT